jgi:hypothetical protein
MKAPLLRFLPAACAIVLLSSCATAPSAKKVDPATLYEDACSIGANSRTVKGAVWLKAQSKEASGQFPAYVTAQAPDRLRMEVTNLVGGTEAVISVQGQKYSIRVPKQKARNEQGHGSWGGIPLRWATELFLGRVPCPAPGKAPAGASLTRAGDDELRVDVPAALGGDPETYVYKFRGWAGRLWPESLHWERQGGFAVAVDFKFDDPEDKTGSPRKWEAKSAQGEVKLRWKDREVQ